MESRKPFYKRSKLMGWLTGTFLFAFTVAFAAVLTLTVTGATANNFAQSAAPCDNAVTVQIGPNRWNNTLGAWAIEDVNVDGIAAACDTKDIQIQLLSASNVAIGDSETFVMDANASQSFTFTDPVEATNVAGVAVALS